VTLGTVLLGFLMGGVLAAPTTVLAQLNSIRRILFILRR
jgi:ABC-type nitrate/sulfonate/bicarbonate transport system permease component